MPEIYFDKLYRYERKAEHCSIAIPIKKGVLRHAEDIAIYQDGKAIPVQPKVTARYKDGSVKYLFVRFMADLPANKGCVLDCKYPVKESVTFKGIQISLLEDGYAVDTGAINFAVRNNGIHLFDYVQVQDKRYVAEQFDGPYLKERNGHKNALQIQEWHIVEQGALCTILAANAVYENKVRCELRLTAYADKSWVEVSYRILNTREEELDIESLIFYCKAEAGFAEQESIHIVQMEEKNDSTGCGDGLLDNSQNDGPIFHTRGITELEMLEQKAPVESVRTMVGSSNYKTDFIIGKNGEAVSKNITGKSLVKEANEHFAEVFYGTFFADRTDAAGGVCITVFQAQQNYPKAIEANGEEIAVFLVPAGEDKVVMQSGMAREQKFLLHFHDAKESILELDNRSLIYQMPDRAYLSPDEFRKAGVMLDVFPTELDDKVEMALIERADSHARCYGMLNWGDSWDPGYTKQGRGNGRLVWSNNEYDFPHSCALQYARTGVRRFLDYLIISAEHWRDVDICHFSSDPLRIGGQWEHTAGHCMDGVMVCSHEWVEGLLDYYHFTGDDRGYDAAIGIGENVLRLLDTPMYAHPGEANARETGWALRTLTALYVETHEERWLAKCEWILHSFEIWEKEYGHWLAPYTDNTTIRVGFMISVAVGSVMRYYREFPDEKLKQMLIRAVDDLAENCMLDCGLFYYKELPSLARLGNNTLLLESLAIAYELTGNDKYLTYGYRTLARAVGEKQSSTNGTKQIIEDAVVCAGGSTKGFAQSFIPMITYYNALTKAGKWEEARKYL